MNTQKRQGDLFDLENRLYLAAMHYPDFRFRLAIKAMDGSKTAAAVIERLLAWEKTRPELSL